MTVADPEARDTRTADDTRLVPPPPTEGRHRAAGAEDARTAEPRAIVIAAIVAGAAAIWGSSYDILSTLNAFPRWPVDQGSLTTGGDIALVILALGSLVGAMLGGLAGMHFHRQVDKVGLADRPVG